MGSPCWGMPQQGLSAPAQSEFPDLRVQYLVFPLMMSLGYDPIWFGVMMALFIEMSLITPPIGLNLFIIQQVAGERSLAPVIRGSFPFFLIMVSVTMLFIAFPEIVLWLPNKI